MNIFTCDLANLSWKTVRTQHPMQNTHNTKSKQTSSLEENIPNQHIDYKYIHHVHNRQLARTNGLVKDSV